MGASGRPILRLDLRAILKNPSAQTLLLPALDELLKRRHHPYKTYKPDNAPDRDQLSFHMALSMFVLMTGGNQSGKSKAGCQELVWWLTGKHPYKKVPKAPKIWAISAMYQNLEAGLYKHFKQVMPAWEIAAEGPKVEGWEIPKWTRAKSGGKVWWLSAEGGGSKSRKKFQAEDLHAAFIDEEVEREVRDEVMMRFLSHGGQMYITATLMESEPWIIEVESQGEAGDPDVTLIRLSSRAAVRAGHIQDKTLRAIEKNLSPEDREVRVFGKSRKSQGLVYPEFVPSKQVTAPRDIRGDDCTRYCAIDPGWDTCAVLWAAVYPYGEILLYRELYLNNKNYRQVSFEILRAEGWAWDAAEKRMVATPSSEVIERRAVDPSAFGTNTDGTPKIAHRLTERGVGQIVPAMNDVDFGIDVVRDTMQDTNADGRRKLMVMRHLVEWLRERASYRYPRKKPRGDRAAPKAKPVKREDHLMDATRYLLTIPGGLTYNAKPSSQAMAALQFKRVKRITGAVGSLHVGLEEDQREMEREEEAAAAGISVGAGAGGSIYRNGPPGGLGGGA